MAFPAVKDRMYGYEFAGSEFKLIFEKGKENFGYVRIKNKKNGLFYLDPSPFFPSPKNEIFQCKNCELPPKGQLIEVTVRETEKTYNHVKDSVEAVLMKYVIGWELSDPNKLRGNNLTSQEEFLNFLSKPMVDKPINVEDLQYCLGMSMVSSPQLSYFERGGINTVVLGEEYLLEKWYAFKKVTSIVPTEFKQPSSRNYYQYLENSEQPRPINSCEINLSYLNIVDVPIHMPLPFNMRMNAFKTYKEDFNHFLPLARAFLIDTLLFQPTIPDKLQKRMEDIMYFILDEVSSTGVIPYYQDIGSVIPKLSTSYARLNFNSYVTLNDLKASKEIWKDTIDDSRLNSRNGIFVDKKYDLSVDESKLLLELKILKNAGIPLTFENIKKNTKIFDWNFDKVLERLKICGYVYFPNYTTIGLLND